MNNFKAKQKQDNISASEVRTHQVKVMLNDEEVDFLDSVRGQHSRAETFRFLLQDSPPKSVPELNQGAWVELASSAANLNQISRKINFGENVEIDEIREQLSEFRAALIGAEISRGDA
jgi:hypothetical protein